MTDLVKRLRAYIPVEGQEGLAVRDALRREAAAEIERLTGLGGPGDGDSLLLPLQRYTFEPLPGGGYQFTTTTDGLWVMAKDVADVGTEARTLMRRAVDYMGSANHFPSWVGEMEEFLSRFAATAHEEKS